MKLTSFAEWRTEKFVVAMLQHITEKQGNEKRYGVHLLISYIALL